MEFHPEKLFSEPDGWEQARSFVLSSLILLGIYAFFELLLDVGLLSAFVLGVAMGVGGIAELLPVHRRWSASVLRFTGIGMCTAVIVWSLFQLLT